MTAEFLIKAAKMSGVTGSFEQLKDFADLINLEDRAKHHELNLARIQNRLKELSDMIGKLKTHATTNSSAIKRLQKDFYEVLTEIPPE